jgi:DtxR family transcriptional regulator, Mn-dependent transcriptional regulator
LKLSSTEENYIKSIYHLQFTSDSGMVNTNALASIVESKAASVTDMLKKLKQKKIISYKKYHGFKLNENGTRIALEIVRRHRLWEYFLSTHLGFEWNKVHEIAEELEHVSSRELIAKLDEFLGTPRTDPHGDPIPDIHGRVPVIKQINLYDVPLKKNATVSSVSNQSSEMLEMLSHYQISIGTSIKVLRNFEFDKSLEIKVAKNSSCIISEQLAKNIFVYHDQQINN